jgi:hypothetical protein
MTLVLPDGFEPGAYDIEVRGTDNGDTPPRLEMPRVTISPRDSQASNGGRVNCSVHKSFSPI